MSQSWPKLLLRLAVALFEWLLYEVFGGET